MTRLLPNVETGNLVVDMLCKSLPTAAPLFASLFLFAAVISFFNAWRKRRQLDTQKDINSIKALSWRAIEEMVAEAYRRKGYKVIEGGFGPDGGIDVKLIKIKK